MKEKEFAILGIVTVLFAATFLIASVTALFISYGIPLIELCSGEYGNCVDTSAGQMFAIAAIFAVMGTGIACCAWLILWLNDMPHVVILPIWTLTFAALVAYLTYLGEEAAGMIYLAGFVWLTVNLLSDSSLPLSSLPLPRTVEAYLWIPATLLLTGYLYVLIRRRSD